MSETLDTLLSQPLAEMPDNGFSNQVAAEMELRQLRRDRLKTEISAGLVVLAVMILPFTEAGQLLAVSAATHAGMALVGLTLAAIFTGFAFRTR